MDVDFFLEQKKVKWATKDIFDSMPDPTMDLDLDLLTEITRKPESRSEKNSFRIHNTAEKLLVWTQHKLNFTGSNFGVVLFWQKRKVRPNGRAHF
jgi:hypothetical protein